MPADIGIQIALLIDDYRIPGTIDLPALMNSNPNYNIIQTNEQNKGQTGNPGNKVEKLIN